MSPGLLRIESLRVQYPTGAGPITAVDAVDLQVQEGQRVGLVGESGSGKSTLAFAATRLLRPPGRASAGRVLFEGRDLLELDEAACNQLRGTRLAMVFQDPFTFLNPLIPVGDQVAETLEVHASCGRKQARTEAARMLERLGLRPGAAIA